MDIALSILALAVSIAALGVAYWSRRDNAVFRQTVEARRLFGAELGKLGEAQNDLNRSLARSEAFSRRYEEELERCRPYLQPQGVQDAEDSIASMRTAETDIIDIVRAQRTTIQEFWDVPDPSPRDTAVIQSISAMYRENTSTLDIRVDDVQEKLDQLAKLP